MAKHDDSLTKPFMWTPPPKTGAPSGRHRMDEILWSFRVVNGVTFAKRAE